MVEKVINEICIQTGIPERIVREKEETNKRKIIFRGKRVNDGKRIYGYYWSVKEYYLDSAMNNKHFIKSINNGIDYEVIPETVGQFTGLYDIKSKPIFEGDIVTGIGIHGRLEVTGEVFIDLPNGTKLHQMNTEDCLWHLSCFKQIEVIGNIYDNPELLEVKHDC